MALPAYGIVVSLTNFLLRQVVEFGATWLKFTDITSEAKFQMTLLYGLQFFNMAVPLLLINFNFSEAEWVTRVQ